MYVIFIIAAHSQTIDVSFKRRGVVVYRAITWPGFVGLSTVMKVPVADDPFGYSVSVNYRFLNDSLLFNVAQLLRRAWPVSILLRHTIEEVRSFPAAVEYLALQPLISPCYFTMCGLRGGEGIILSRNRIGQSDRVDQKRCKSLDEDNDSDEGQRAGFRDSNSVIVQTNIDHARCFDSEDVIRRWAGEDELLLSAKERRLLALQRLTRTVRGVQDWSAPAVASRIWSACAIEPVCNGQTIFVCLMSVGSDPPVFETRVLTSVPEYCASVQASAPPVLLSPTAPVGRKSKSMSGKAELIRNEQLAVRVAHGHGHGGSFFSHNVSAVQSFWSGQAWVLWTLLSCLCAYLLRVVLDQPL